MDAGDEGMERQMTTTLGPGNPPVTSIGERQALACRRAHGRIAAEHSPQSGNALSLGLGGVRYVLS